MRFPTALAILVTAHASAARARCLPNDDDLPCEEPYVAWSWLPQVSALLAYDELGHAHSLFGAEVRLRRNSPHEQQPPTVHTLAIGVETYQHETIEPYAQVGIAHLMQLCTLCSDNGQLYGTAHVALGGGVQWADGRREPFALGRVSLGLVFARPHGAYIAVDGERGDVRATRYQLRSQIDLVLETAVAFDGSYRIALGIALDPVRLLLDLASY